MFKFGFSNSDDENIEAEQNNVIQWQAAKEIIPQLSKHDETKHNAREFEYCNDIKLQYISSAEVVDSLKKSNNETSSILRAETDHSDLVTGEYEGGLKIWECTSDLLNYLSAENICFANKKVLDLGCGAGILGIYSLLKGSLVDFQDYNNEVIEHTTIANVILNLENNHEQLKNCKFYSGDWKSFMNLTTTKYDYILTSETIYNPDNYQKLLDVFKQLINTNGVIYLAAKTYYFGVGGGIRQFEQLMNKDGIFTSTVCWKQVNGVQREILKIVKN